CAKGLGVLLLYFDSW
nr:immunoglobulin heavy chain junction region [Macaca mulatta]MOX38499.1 immunoglobulin heavy chain junction region [Macaca mulatta]MOX39231.1 immunoglobulin heavy chain junction region [Macaca mulatta]MOX39757.1 immunoglobulin heavy chain junction region [Macaca mulatta]MOX40080.1 immunoglobulin heavy chain junction region [Macaca mulatta]